jgi:hypothetical protein
LEEEFVVEDIGRRDDTVDVGEKYYARRGERMAPVLAPFRCGHLTGNGSDDY